jgi:hypothetical protein
LARRRVINRAAAVSRRLGGSPRSSAISLWNKRAGLVFEQDAEPEHIEARRDSGNVKDR